jgi:outer membrane protein assembly factor BamB
MEGQFPMKRTKSHIGPLGLPKLLAQSLVFGGFFSIFGHSTTSAGDWPQILGPARNGQAEGEELPNSLPAKPKISWRAKVGSGYAGPVVVARKVIVFHRVGKQELVEALDAGTGQRLWKAEYEARYRGGFDRDLGPRCVPLVRDGKVYVFGAAGDLHCLTLANGKKLWTRELYVDYEGDEGYFGAGSTPILVGGKLVVNVGGKGAGLVALDPATGKTLWNGTSEVGSYSSPAAVKIGGKEQAIFITRMNCVLFDPATNGAKILFPFGKSGPTVNAATPLIFDGKLFVTASYNIGAELRSLDGTTVKEVWGNDETLSSQYATAVEHKGYLYGIHGWKDAGGAHLRCVEATTGRIAWSKENFGIAHAILAGDKILLVGVEGTLTLLAADPKKFRSLGSAEFVAVETRPLPAFSDGKLFVKTNEGEGSEVVSVDLGKN